MVALACTVFVLLIIAGIMVYNLRVKLKYGIFQSVILGLLLSIPILYMFIMDFLNIIGHYLFRLAAILGGENLDTLLSKMMIFMVSEVGGVSEVQIKTDNEPSETEETDSQPKGDR